MPIKEKLWKVTNNRGTVAKVRAASYLLAPERADAVFGGFESYRIMSVVLIDEPAVSQAEILEAIKALLDPDASRFSRMDEVNAFARDVIERAEL